MNNWCEKEALISIGHFDRVLSVQKKKMGSVPHALTLPVLSAFGWTCNLFPRFRLFKRGKGASFALGSPNLRALTTIHTDKTYHSQMRSDSLGFVVDIWGPAREKPPSARAAFASGDTSNTISWFSSSLRPAPNPFGHKKTIHSPDLGLGECLKNYNATHL